MAVAACAVIAIALVVWRIGIDRTSSNSTAVIAQTVNLFDTGVVRGEQPQQLQSVSLPAALIKLTIVLPRHSAPGQYLVAITRDQNGNGVVGPCSHIGSWEPADHSESRFAKCQGGTIFPLDHTRARSSCILLPASDQVTQPIKTNANPTLV